MDRIPMENQKLVRSSDLREARSEILATIGGHEDLRIIMTDAGIDSGRLAISPHTSLESAINLLIDHCVRTNAPPIQILMQAVLHRYPEKYMSTCATLVTEASSNREDGVSHSDELQSALQSFTFPHDSQPCPTQNATKPPPRSALVRLVINGSLSEFSKDDSTRISQAVALLLGLESPVQITNFYEGSVVLEFMLPSGKALRLGEHITRGALRELGVVGCSIEYLDQVQDGFVARGRSTWKVATPTSGSKQGQSTAGPASKLVPRKYDYSRPPRVRITYQTESSGTQQVDDHSLLMAIIAKGRVNSQALSLPGFRELSAKPGRVENVDILLDQIERAITSLGGERHSLQAEKASTAEQLLPTSATHEISQLQELRDQLLELASRLENEQASSQASASEDDTSEEP